MNNLKLGKYRHYKGDEYQVIGCAKHSETLEDLVVYKALYSCDEFGDNVLWVRPIKMFSGKVTHNSKEVLRFEYIGK